MIQAPQGLKKLFSGYPHGRILRLTFPNKDVLPSEPLVNQLDASEWRSRDFTLTLRSWLIKPDLSSETCRASRST
ncbi:hypothetical protein [Herbaspirillum rubrisubalbicans]|uniref:hypothetical protein n=1 Tax=Herbaspirillum rubrisubalbicans TaxID=80842 RepID=UPI0015C56E6A|nr:hypothetical protein [Herbaspirillum rubrisubalbicans]MCP1573297.1 hypothetical protein [Herbaspirillum rubrisubalbicans]